jgi:hypothetical protein
MPSESRLRVGENRHTSERTTRLRFYDATVVPEVFFAGAFFRRVVASPTNSPAF